MTPLQPPNPINQPSPASQASPASQPTGAADDRDGPDSARLSCGPQAATRRRGRESALATANPGGTKSGEGSAREQEASVDLARLLIPDPEHTLLVRVCGESMLEAGIRHGDLLVVERRRQARTGAIVVARLGGRFTLKRLRHRGEQCWLEAAHPAYPPLDLEATATRQGLTAADVELWGVAVHVIRTL